MRGDRSGRIDKMRIFTILAAVIRYHLLKKGKQMDVLYDENALLSLLVASTPGPTDEQLQRLASEVEQLQKPISRIMRNKGVRQNRISHAVRRMGSAIYLIPTRSVINRIRLLQVAY